jgi:hypothetical protein
MENDFSLDNLLVEEEEVRTPAIMPVTVLVSETEYDEQTNLDEIADNIKRKLLEDYGFRRKEKRRYREGFLDFNFSANAIKCVYARETPTRLDFEKGDLKISTRRLRAINPSYKVLINIYLTNTKAKIILFGGDDKISAAALRLANYCIRGCVKGGFRTYQTSFSKEEMDAIRSKFGDDIQYVFLSPGDSEKLRKIAKQKIKGEIKEILQYSARAKFAGYRVVAAPAVLDLISEGKISLLELEGRLGFGGGISITTRVSASGRITFFIPDNIVGRNQTAYDIAEELYKRIASQRTGTKQLGMEDFTAGI